MSITPFGLPSVPDVYNITATLFSFLSIFSLNSNFFNASILLDILISDFISSTYNTFVLFLIILMFSCIFICSTKVFDVIIVFIFDTSKEDLILVIPDVKLIIDVVLLRFCNAKNNTEVITVFGIIIATVFSFSNFFLYKIDSNIDL